MELRANPLNGEAIKQPVPYLKLIKKFRFESERLFVARQFQLDTDLLVAGIRDQLKVINKRFDAARSSVFISCETDEIIAEAGDRSVSFILAKKDELQLFRGERIVKESHIIQPLAFNGHVIGFLLILCDAATADNRLLSLAEAYSELILKELELSVNKKALDNFSSQVARQKKASISNEKHNQIVMKMAAHDMSSPLNAIHGYLEMIDTCLNKKDDLEAVKKYHRQISTGIHDISAILAQFEDITTIKSKDDAPQKVVVNLNWMLQEISDFFSEKAKKKNLQMICELPDTPSFVRADITKLKRTVVNLVTNAIKYSDKKGEVRIELAKEKGTAVIKVIDQGIGIRPEKQKEVFKPFFQVSEDTHKKDPSSVGLGLYIASNFVKQMGGRMDLESKPYTGSCFYIYLPAAERIEMEQNI
ncbi:MAG TPA: HAMP domain-containing sensor histidine kinase [Balneolaceae bacterium]|nr:HAMP domain-containing sensor histidine kinase [Balneolaceae bacterium]